MNMVLDNDTEEADFEEIVADVDLPVPFWEQEHEGRYSIRWSCQWPDGDTYIFAPSPEEAEKRIRHEYDIADDVDVTVRFRKEGFATDSRTNATGTAIAPPTTNDPEAR